MPCQPGLPCKFLNQRWATTESAEECPNLVDGRCPHAGTGRSGERFNTLRGMRILFRSDTEDKFALESRHPEERRI